MGDQQMPDDRLEGFNMGRHRAGADRWHNHTSICYLGGVATIAAHHAADGRSNLPGVLETTHQIKADVMFQIASPHREEDLPAGCAQEPIGRGIATRGP